jgi:hypothetical protein
MERIEKRKQDMERCHNLATEKLHRRFYKSITKEDTAKSTTIVSQRESKDKALDGVNVEARTTRASEVDRDVASTDTPMEPTSKGGVNNETKNLLSQKKPKSLENVDKKDKSKTSKKRAREEEVKVEEVALKVPDVKRRKYGTKELGQPRRLEQLVGVVAVLASVIILEKVLNTQ